MRRDDGCLDYSGGESVIVYPCHGQKGNQEWQYREVGQDQIKKKITLIHNLLKIKWLRLTYKKITVI